MNPRLPPELERKIFEIGAHEDSGIIQTLLRVAHRTRIWMEPMFYRVLWVDGHARSEKTYAILAGLYPKPPGFLEDAVRHMYLDETSHLSRAEARALLCMCENVVDLAVTGRFAEPGLLPMLGGMHIHRLSTNLSNLFGGSHVIDFNHPLFLTVTDLQMWDAMLDVWTYMQLAALPALTHLCLTDTVSWEEWEARSVFRMLLVECKRLKVLVDLAPSHREWRMRGRAMNMASADPRLVMVSMVFTSYPLHWGAGAEVKRGADLWAAADSFVAARRRGEIAESDWLTLLPH
ncbi:hypothetical protein K438DRAFT_1849213 [Mycena galopus ATCC 62051]|nr:hypothetical protein K438DRAFT_1849213 [Mycena galopus ATCC 62051]